MSIYTTELRFICEQYAGLEESVGLSRIDEVLDKAIPKVFDFDFPIFEENYREVLERKILTHFYTREIGYETVGRWKLALRAKLNEIMPYYNQLYKRSADFGRVNIFDNVSYDTSRSIAGNKSSEENTENISSSTGSENGNKVLGSTFSENKDINRDESATKNTSVHVTEGDNRTLDKNNNSTVNKETEQSGGSNTVGADNRDITRSNTHVSNTTGSEDNNTNRNDSRSVVNNNTVSGNVTENDNKTHTGSQTDNSEQNVSNAGGSVTDNSTKTQSDSSSIGGANEIKRRLYSDTPSGALDFGYNGGGNVEDDEGNTVWVGNDYITNLTKDIGNSSNNANAHSDTSVDGKEKANYSNQGYTDSKFNSTINANDNEQRNVVSNNSSKGNSLENGSVDERGNKTVSGHEDSSNTESVKDVNRNSKVDSNYSNGTEVDTVNSNENVTENINKNRKENSGETVSNFNNEKVTGVGQRNENESVNTTRMSNEDRRVVAKGLMRSTENYVEQIKGKHGDGTYSAMFMEFQKALVNVDMMVIDELNVLFMGLWE